MATRSTSFAKWRFKAVAFALVSMLSLAPLAWADDSSSQQGNGGEGVSLTEEENVINENQLPDTSFIYDSTITELASADSYYDKQTVQVVGEATGDIINDEHGSDYCWVMLWEESTASAASANASSNKSESGTNTANKSVTSTNTLTVFMSKENAKLIDTLGTYSRKGTTLQVRGTFNLVCSEHNGISDLHATNVTVTKRGGVATHEVSFGMFVPGILLLLVGGGLALLFNRIREKMR